MERNQLRYFVPIHFVNGEGNFREFREGLDRYAGMRERFKQKTDRFRFGLKITTDNANLTPELRTKVRDLVGRLDPDVMVLYDPINKGPGTSLRQVFFNPTFTRGLAMTICLDQQVIDSEEAVERAIDFTDKIEIDKSLYATGSRNIPVVLGKNKASSDLRIVHELFNALAIRSNYLKPKETLNRVNPAYALIGEHTTGFDVVYQGHQLYPELTKSITHATQVADMNGFASCYYVPLKSAQLGGLRTSGYVCARKNPFPDKIDSDVEYKKVSDMISYQTEQLGKTDVRPLLEIALLNQDNTKQILEFYDASCVNFVRDLMVKGLERSKK